MVHSGRMQKFIYGEAATPTLPKSTLSCDLLSGKSGPKDQVALHYYCTSPSHWCTTHEVSKCKFHNGCRTISRHADGISRYTGPPSAGPLLPLDLLVSRKPPSRWRSECEAAEMLQEIVTSNTRYICCEAVAFSPSDGSTLVHPPSVAAFLIVYSRLRTHMPHEINIRARNGFTRRRWRLEQAGVRIAEVAELCKRAKY